MAVVWGFLDSIINKCKSVYVIRVEMEHPSLSTFDQKSKGFLLFQEVVHNISRLFPLKVENYILQFLLIKELER